MYKYIKKALFILSLLAISHMNSVVKAMDFEDEHNTLAFGISGVREVRNDESSLVTQSTSLQALSLDEPQISWGASIKSYGQSIGKLAQDIASNPYNGLIVSTYVLLNFATPAAACYCTCAAGGGPSTCNYIGYPVDNNTCYEKCRSSGYKHYVCY